MSAIVLDGKLYMMEQERAFKGKDVVRFLKHLMRQIPGKLLIIWDGSAIHRGLPEPCRVEGRATQGQGTLETEKRCHPRLHKAARIRGLGVCAEISKSSALE
jgi:hypothetical protein